MKVDSQCQVCGLEGESQNHVLFTCSFARQVWTLSGIPYPANGFSTDSIFQNFNHLLEMQGKDILPKEFVQSFPWVLWLLWTNRNKLNFEGFCIGCDESDRAE